MGKDAVGANVGARPAANAKVGVAFYLLSRLVAGNGFCRADGEAGIAAHGFIAAVCAKLLLVGQELGLLKLAHHVAQLEQGRKILAIPLEIALGRRVLQKARAFCASASEVQNQIKLFCSFCRHTIELNGAGRLANFDARSA